jgi:hypothetical protein
VSQGKAGFQYFKEVGKGALIGLGVLALIIGGFSVGGFGGTSTNNNPDAVYGLLGTNQGTSSNVGFYILYDDRLSQVRNNRILALNSRGGASNREVFLNQTADNAHPANTAVILTHISNPAAAAAADRSILRINGTEIKNNTFANAPTPSTAFAPLQIGAAGNGATPMIGDLYALAIFPLSAGLATAIKAEGFLAGPVAGFNLQASLATGHPFKSFAPTI